MEVIWPEKYSPDSTAVHVSNELQGCSLSWRMFGVTLSSKVEEFVSCERLAWSAQFGGVDAYHAWLIEKNEAGCRVLTEENQRAGWPG